MHLVKSVEVEKEFRVCDRCNRHLDPNANDVEYAESVSISFRSGYGSIFEDGTYVHGDFCQHCLREVLGKYLKVQDENPLQSQRSAPRRAYQPYQLHDQFVRDELDWAVSQLFEKIENEVKRQIEKRRQTPSEISRSIANLRELMTGDENGDVK